MSLTRWAFGGFLSAIAVTACGFSGGPSTGGAPTRSQGVALATCMRSHGISGFPDPIAGHGLQFNLSPGLNPRAPAFVAAQKACQNVAFAAHPGGGGGASAGQQAAALAHAQCMRSHGVPSYPDPTYKGGRPAVYPLSNYGIDEQSPAFLSAAKACGGE